MHENVLNCIIHIKQNFVLKYEVCEIGFSCAIHVYIIENSPHFMGRDGSLPHS